MAIRNRGILVLVAVMIDDPFFEIADNDNKFVGSKPDKLVETMSQDGLVVDLNHSFGLGFSQWPETGSFTGGQHDSFHTISPINLFVYTLALRGICTKGDEEPTETKVRYDGNAGRHEGLTCD